MIPRLEQALQGLNLHAPSLVGHGLPERLRSVTIGMVGLVAAAGLGLVAVAVDQGLPGVTSSPIPGLPSEHVGAAQAVAGPAAAPVHPRALRAPAGAAGSAARGTPNSHPASAQTHNRPGGVAPGVKAPGAAPHPGHGGAGAPATGAPAGAGAPATAPPAATTAPAQAPAASPPVEAPATSAAPPGKGKGNGNGKAKGHEKSSYVGSPATPQASSAPAPPAASNPGEDGAVSGEDWNSQGGNGNGNGNGHAYGHSK